MPVILDVQAGRKALIMLRPEYDPPQEAQRTALAAYLDSCVAAGLEGTVMLWPQPARSGLTPAQYLAMIDFYGPTARSRYPLAYGSVMAVSSANLLSVQDATFAGAGTGTWVNWYGASLAKGTPPVAAPQVSDTALQITSVVPGELDIYTGWYPASPGVAYGFTASYLAGAGATGVGCEVWIEFADAAQVPLGSSSLADVTDATTAWASPGTPSVTSPAGTAYVRMWTRIFTTLAGQVHWLTAAGIWDLTGGGLDPFFAYFPGAAKIDAVMGAYYCAAWTDGVRLESYAAVADAAALPFGLHAIGISSGDQPTDGYGYAIYVAQVFADRFNAGLRGDVLWEQEAPYLITGDSYMIPLYDAVWDAVTLGISPTIEPPEPPAPPPPPLPAAILRKDWAWVLGPPQPTGGHTVALTKATNQRLVLRVEPGESDEASFTVRAEDAAQPYVQELLTDLQVWRGGQQLFTGRIIPTDDALESSHRTTVTARDYRAVLARRRPGASSYTSWRQTDIAWNLIASTQAQDAGWLGIRKATATPGDDTHRTISFAADEYVAPCIDKMAVMKDGFDWDIEPAGSAGLNFRAWYPQRERDNGVTLEWGSSAVRAISRGVDPSEYANSVYAVTQDGQWAVAVDAVDLATRPEGRWDSAFGVNLKSSNDAAVVSWAVNKLKQLQDVIPAYTVTLAPGAWDGPDHIWKGDWVRLRIRSGRLDVDSPCRVVQIEIDPTTPGREVVTVTLSRLRRRDIRTDIPRILRHLHEIQIPR